MTSQCHRGPKKSAIRLIIITIFENSFQYICNKMYRQVSNISRTLVGNKIVDNSDVVGASPVGTAPTTSSLST